MLPARFELVVRSERTYTTIQVYICQYLFLIFLLFFNFFLFLMDVQDSLFYTEHIKRPEIELLLDFRAFLRCFLFFPLGKRNSFLNGLVRVCSGDL